MYQSDNAPVSVTQLEDMLSCPTAGTIEVLGSIEGDLLILGAGGKMGPSLALMARRASEMAGVDRRVMAASRFSSPDARVYLEQNGVETLVSDLLRPGALESLPEAENIIFMAGMKFGSTHNLGLTWAMNAYLPGLVCDRYRHSRMVVFSTGNIYGLAPVASGGSLEDDMPNPQGEYAMSALGRERVFGYFSNARGIPQSVIRVNYACDLRYGVLVDIARNVKEGMPVSVNMGYFNTIWQRDANAAALISLAHARIPPLVLNITGSQTLRVRDVAMVFGGLFDKEIVFHGQEADDALLSNNSRARTLFGPPELDENTLMEWVASWMQQGGLMLDKPTHFESRDGHF